MGQPGQSTPVQFDVEQAKNVTIVVTAQNGKRYNLDMAVLVLQVTDSGIVNPLDQLPIFQVTSQIVTRVTEHTDGH